MLFLATCQLTLWHVKRAVRSVKLITGDFSNWKCMYELSCGCYPTQLATRFRPSLRVSRMACYLVFALNSKNLIRGKSVPLKSRLLNRGIAFLLWLGSSIKTAPTTTSYRCCAVGCARSLAHITFLITCQLHHITIYYILLEKQISNQRNRYCYWAPVPLIERFTTPP